MSLAFQIAQLRHAYYQLKNGAVKDQAGLADGLLVPVIRAMEKESPPITKEELAKILYDAFDALSNDGAEYVGAYRFDGDSKTCLDGWFNLTTVAEYVLTRLLLR